MTAGACARAAPPAPRPLPQHAFAGQLRATGTLVADAQLQLTTGQQPHMVLQLRLRPAQGMDYVACVDLGDDCGNHMAAESLLPRMRPGAVLSVAAQALQLRMDHGDAVLRMVQPHSVLILEHPTTPPEN